MTPVEIKLESGLSVAVIFIDDMTVALTDVRNQIWEEVDELVPEQFHFISNWGPPITRFQEKKMPLTEALHRGNVLKIRETSSSKRKATEVETSESLDVDNPAPQAGNPPAAEGSAISGAAKTEDLTNMQPSTSSYRSEQPPAKRTVQRTVQRTMTSFFGAKSSPTARYATAAVRKGVHIYSEQDILRSSGAEKERRTWWNEKAKEICEDPKHAMLRGEAIDQKLHEEWRLHKAAKMLQEETDTRNAIEDIIEKYPNMEAFLASINKLKQETLIRNVTRLEMAMQTLTRSRDTRQELSVRLQNTDQRGPEFQKLKKEVEEHREGQKFHYRELSKAQEAMSKVLSVKKTQLRELLEKIKDDTQ